MSQHELTAEEREALHEAMAAWAKVMPYNHLGPEYGLSDGIWTRLDRAVERILAARGDSLAGKVRALAEEWEAEAAADSRGINVVPGEYWKRTHARRLRALLDAAETTGETPPQACEVARGGDFGGAVDQGADDENQGDV